MKEKDILTVTKTEMLSDNFIPSLYEIYKDDDERNAILSEVLSLAKKYKILKTVKSDIQRAKFNDLSKNVLLSLNDDGIPDPSIDNILNILENDETVKNTYAYNALSNQLIKINPDGTQSIWSDVDDNNLMHYIEEKYKIYYPAKYFSALSVASSRKKFNPIKELIEYKKWDGTPRIDKFLVDILKCDDTNYIREASRMIFYGGINRLYHPGCKFDYVPILIGKQGCGKSSIVKWLALNDAYYADLSSIEGKDALENIQGVWMCELSELLAMVKTKEVEAMKSFITRTSDRYRESYGRRTQEFPRTCLFIGTTNNYQFLSDKTGNRRYLPIQMNVKVGEIYSREKYIKNYILECWREALTLLKNDNAYLTIPNKYQKDVINEQDKAVEDDPKVGMILDYLDNKKVKDKVCNIEIFTNCWNGIRKNFDRLASKEISQILSSLPDWKRSDSTYRFETYGTQRYWEKIEVKEKWNDLD